MMRMQTGVLADGRLHLNDGPIDLVISADGKASEVARAMAAARSIFAGILDGLCRELPLLRRAAGKQPSGAVARRMWSATRDHSAQGFITPMAAVAGAVADEVLAAMTAAARLERASVNNGGDIAIYLAPGASYRIGLIDRPDRPSLFGQSAVSASDGIGGIATSGWRGRSFSLGVADAVTVLAATASGADAAATVIANAVDLPGHPAITRVPAQDIQPDSDLGPRLVTRGVGCLTPGEIDAALERGKSCADQLLRRGIIAGCALHLCGQTRVVSRALTPQLQTMVPA